MFKFLKHDRGQIFVQDVSISFFIFMIATIMLITFINFQVSGFNRQARQEHMLIAGERVLQKMLLTGDYEFNTAKYTIDDRFLVFTERLNQEDTYEKFRYENALNREGISYDVGILADCGDDVIKGGTFGKEPVIVKSLAIKDGNVCKISVWISMR